MLRDPQELAEELTILYQDDDVVVVNKPSGLLVHRGWGRDRVVAMTVTRNRVGKHVYPVHRLDRPTSGALVFALHKDAARGLAQGFERGDIDKRYVALVRGITPEEGVIDHPVPKTPKGKRVDAVTEFRRLFTFERYSLVEARPKTGRLHQIRRHLRHITHPLVGDVNYGVGDLNRLFRERFDLWRLALHAAELGFAHPMTGEPVRCKAPYPDDLAEPLRKMGVPEALLSI
jgi:tRNA pseudouridine65 synthase